MITEFRFGPWLPDAIDFKNPGLEDALNVIPSPEGYQPALGPDTASANVGAAVLSAAMFERADGTRVTVCATAGDLHTVINGTVTDSSLGLSLTDPVAFERYGSSIYATSKSGVWYLDDIEADNTFAAESWTIPHGAVIGRVNDFLFMGDLTDTDSSDAPFRIRWSPFNDPQGEWETSIATQSDAVDMPEGYGPVTGIGPGTYGVIFQKNAISRISYTGGTAVFAKVIVDRERGCIAPRSIVTVGDRHYFLAHDGFFYTDGGPAQPISRGRVWRWFLENSQATYSSAVSGAVNWPDRCILWSIQGDSGAPIGLLCFNWETENWSHIDLTFDAIFASGRDGVSLEDVAATYSNIDTMPVSLDSPEFAARGRSVGVFVGGEMSQLAGSSLGAMFETAEWQPAPGKRSFVREISPLITNASEDTTVKVGGRVRSNDAISFSSDVSLGPAGFAPVNFDARYLRAQFRIPAGTNWTDAYGFQADYSVSGAT